MNENTNEYLLHEYHYLINSGHSQRQACESLGVARSTMQDLLKRSMKPEFEGKIEGFNKGRGPKILVIDLESACTLFAGFGRFNQNFGQDSVYKEGDYILTAAWKWLGEKKVYSTYIKDPEDRWNGDDLDVVTEIWDVLDQADIVIGQNVKSFDLGLVKARCALHGLPPFRAVKVIDTLQIAKSMKFPSNKLDSLASYLGIGRKTSHSGIKLWLDVMKGDEDALSLMCDYNVNDVILTEEVYMRLRAFDTKPVNMAHFYDDELPRCSVCGSDDLEETGESTYTEISEFKEIVCNNCGHRHRNRIAINSKEKRKNILLTPR